ncbi:MAG: hypothetical protein HZA31_09680 [Opitutae bacterium]|nr:hypothetical protein [Opitutae bacterium]
MRTSPLLSTLLLVGALSTPILGQTPPTAPKTTAPDGTAAQPPAATAAPAPAQSAAPAAPAEPEVKIKGTEPAGVGIVAKGAKDATGRDTLSVDFPDEEIRNILRNVADLFELNLVIPETLQGKTSVKLRDVTWRQIFQVVLGPVNYTYIEDGHIIKIVSNESLQQEPVATEVFILNYAKAADIQATITSLVDTGAGGKLVVDARSNALVITERPSRFNRIRPIIESLDRATDQVMIESKFVEVTDRDVRNLGTNWTSLQNYQVKAGSLNEQFTRGREQSVRDTNGAGLNNSDTLRNTNSLNNTANQTSGSNTLNNVTATNGALSSTSTTGTTGNLTNSSTNSSLVESIGDAALTRTLAQEIGNLASTNRTLTAVFSANDFSVVLSALSTLNNTKIVSNPTIVTLNNTEAVINVGEEFPVPNYTYNQQTGTFEVSGFNYRPIGIMLKVTPQVNARGFVKLTIEPEVSQRNGETSFGGAGGASIPIIATRKAKTQVSLKDGFTMGIGGLLRKQTTDGTTKVPLLGDIPFLGYAFKSKSKNEETTNLLIFITAKVVSAEGAPIEQIFDANQVRGLNMRESDLPGHREKTSPFLPPEGTEKGKTKKKPFFRLSNSDSK